MFGTLHSRLFLTYAFLSGGKLFIFKVGKIIFLIRNPNTSRQTLQRLNILSLVIEQRREVLEDISPDQISTTRSRTDEIFNIRFILLNSAREIVIDTRLRSEASLPQSLISLTSGSRIDRGQFRDANGETWLYARHTLDDRNTLIFASRRLRLSMRPLILEDLSTPFIGAILIVLILASIFAYRVSDWVTASLRHFSEAAENITKGEFHHLNMEGSDKSIKLVASHNDMSDQVIASQESQRDLVAKISHDLKTTLTLVQGYAQAILDGNANTDGDIHLLKSYSMKRNG